MRRGTAARCAGRLPKAKPAQNKRCCRRCRRRPGRPLTAPPGAVHGGRARLNTLTAPPSVVSPPPGGPPPAQAASEPASRPPPPRRAPALALPPLPGRRPRSRRIAAGPPPSLRAPGQAAAHGGRVHAALGLASSAAYGCLPCVHTAMLTYRHAYCHVIPGRRELGDPLICTRLRRPSGPALLDALRFALGSRPAPAPGPRAARLPAAPCCKHARAMGLPMCARARLAEVEPPPGARAPSPSCRPPLRPAGSALLPRAANSGAARRGAARRRVPQMHKPASSLPAPHVPLPSAPHVPLPSAPHVSDAFIAARGPASRACLVLIIQCMRVCVGGGGGG
jgi:hypothetical protein